MRFIGFKLLSGIAVGSFELEYPRDAGVELLRLVPGNLSLILW